MDWRPLAISSGGSLKDAHKNPTKEHKTAWTPHRLKQFSPATSASPASPKTSAIDRWHTLRIGPPRVSVGRKVLYRRDSVRAWLQSREQRKVRG